MESFIALPFRIDESTGGVASSTSASQKYRQFIAAVLTTNYRERVMRPTYGSSLGEYMFMPNIEGNPADQFIREALAKWVPDVKVIGIDNKVEPDTGMITLNITYSLPDASIQTLTLFQDNIGDIGDGDTLGATRFVVKTEELYAGTYRTRVDIPTGQVIYE